MPSLGSFGPLEALFLLQRIQHNDSAPLSFDILAQYLKTTKKVFRDETSNHHIDPKSLELLYLKLLKEEVKLEFQKNRASSPLPDGPPNPRKRKLSSPPLDTLEEASNYKHLIPQVAARIYGEYRHSVAKRIEDEERRYRLLRKDIEETERGEWDTKLQPDGTTKGRDSQGVSSIQTLLQNKPSDPEHAPLRVANGRPSSPLPPIEKMLPSQNLPPNAPLWDNQPPAFPNANGNVAILAPATPGATSREPASNSAASPRRAQQTSYATHELPSNVSRPPSQPASATSGAPFYPPPPPPPPHALQGYHKTPTPPDVHGRQPSQPANIAPAPITRPHQAPLPPPDRSSGSPIILPPPPGMLRNTSSPSGSLDALTDANAQKYRPNLPHPPHPPHPPHYPVPSGYNPNPYQYPTYENRSPYQNHYSTPYNQMPPNPYQTQQHTPIAPYQQANSNNGQNSYYNARPPFQPPAPHPHYPSHSNASPFTPQRAVAPSFSQYPAPLRPLEQKTPVSTSNVKRQLPKPSPINTSVSSTKWKNVDAPSGVESPRSPIRPRPEEISPLSERAPSPVFKSSELHRASAAVRKGIASSAAEDTPTPSDIPPPAKRGRGRRPRGTSSRRRGARGASTASSTHQTGTRSESVASGADADELSLEPPASTTTRTAIKHETPATPAALRDSSASIPPTATTEVDSNRKSTRRRRETLQDLDSVDGTRTGTKRKRTNTLDTPEAESRPTNHSAEFEKQKEELSPTHILASRNFTRTSATLMNDITAHKFAGIFAKPLTLPGYNSIIYRRQDLKSIKSAITNGGRALTAILEQERDKDDKAIVPVAGAGGSDTRIWVKKTDDIVPPKGIVNSAQLEKEVMRVFANAVMFNPDPHRSLVGPAYGTRAKMKERHIPSHLTEQEEDEDEADASVREEDGGVVKDAREMFEDVERVVGEWRAAERAAEEKAAAVTAVKMRGGDEEEADELAGDDSAAAATEEKPEKGAERPGKRRRR
ncbi:MAG: hypothetical protein Q9194_005235 [Teloschistes cf. exilis]